MKNQSTQHLTRAALIGALYALLTVLLQPISFGAVQFRISEALTLLPILMPEAVSGLFAGCLLSNLLGGGVWFDVALGALATLLAAVLTRRFRNHPFLAAAMPVLLNGLIVGPVVYLAYVRAPGEAVNGILMLSSMGTIALSEAVICYALGLPLLKLLKRLPGEHIGV